MNQVSGLYLTMTQLRLKKTYGMISISPKVTGTVPLEIVERILEIHIHTDWSDRYFQKQLEEYKLYLQWRVQEPPMRVRKDGSKYSQNYNSQLKLSMFPDVFMGMSMIVRTGLAKNKSNQEKLATFVQFLIEEDL
jgi:hypothetical protein